MCYENFGEKRPFKILRKKSRGIKSDGMCADNLSCSRSASNYQFDGLLILAKF